MRGRACSSPMRERSQTMRRRSAPQDDRTVSFLGDHPIWNTSSAWCSSTCSRLDRLRRSCSATCPPRRKFAHITFCACVIYWVTVALLTWGVSRPRFPSPRGRVLQSAHQPGYLLWAGGRTAATPTHLPPVTQLAVEAACGKPSRQATQSIQQSNTVRIK